MLVCLGMLIPFLPSRGNRQLSEHAGQNPASTKCSWEPQTKLLTELVSGLLPVVFSCPVQFPAWSPEKCCLGNYLKVHWSIENLTCWSVGVSAFTLYSTVFARAEPLNLSGKIKMHCWLFRWMKGTIQQTGVPFELICGREPGRAALAVSKIFRADFILCQFWKWIGVLFVRDREFPMPFPICVISSWARTKCHSSQEYINTLLSNSECYRKSENKQAGLIHFEGTPKGLCLFTSHFIKVKELMRSSAQAQHHRSLHKICHFCIILPLIPWSPSSDSCWDWKQQIVCYSYCRLEWDCIHHGGAIFQYSPVKLSCGFLFSHQNSAAPSPLAMFLTAWSASRLNVALAGYVKMPCSPASELGWQIPYIFLPE